jgi:hypothetical protein
MLVSTQRPETLIPKKTQIKLRHVFTYLCQIFWIFSIQEDVLISFSMSDSQLLHYEALQQESSFRLLKLHPGTADDKLITTLIEVSFDDPTAEYEAISYTWGSAPPSCVVFCNDRSILLTPNCFDALKQLRRSSEVRWLWIDSICIDQFSVSERNHQVAMMGKIYRKAHQVIAWLGRGDKISHTAYQFLHKATDHIKETAKNEYDAADMDTEEDIWRILGAKSVQGTK